MYTMGHVIIDLDDDVIQYSSFFYLITNKINLIKLKMHLFLCIIHSANNLLT